MEPILSSGWGVMEVWGVCLPIHLHSQPPSSWISRTCGRAQDVGWGWPHWLWGVGGKMEGRARMFSYGEKDQRCGITASWAFARSGLRQGRKKAKGLKFLLTEILLGQKSCDPFWWQEDKGLRLGMGARKGKCFRMGIRELRIACNNTIHVCRNPDCIPGVGCIWGFNLFERILANLKHVRILWLRSSTRSLSYR